MEYPTEQDFCYVRVGSVLSSDSDEFLVERFMGEGSFSQVFQCLHLDTGTNVAIKVGGKSQDAIDNAVYEAKMLDTVSVLDPEGFSLVQTHGQFMHGEHPCLVFEMLDRSLTDFMRARMPEPLSLAEIRPIVNQLLRALSGLEHIGVIHADITMDNIMLVNYPKEHYRVKLIDFGCAVRASILEPGWELQTLFDRAPDLLLGLPITEAIDMWSLGIVTAAMFLGTDLYPADHEYDLMRFIVETQGLPEQRLLDAGINTRTFFTRDPDPDESCLGSCKGDDWRLKTPEEFHHDTGYSSVETRRVIVSCLDALSLDCPNATGLEYQDLQCFLDLLKQMLHLDPEKRIKPLEALDHPFVTMSFVKHDSVPDTDMVLNDIVDTDLDLVCDDSVPDTDMVLNDIVDTDLDLVCDDSVPDTDLMLHLDPEKRIKPLEALHHPFVTMSHVRHNSVPDTDMVLDDIVDTDLDLVCDDSVPNTDLVSDVSDDEATSPRGTKE